MRWETRRRVECMICQKASRRSSTLVRGSQGSEARFCVLVFCKFDKDEEWDAYMRHLRRAEEGDEKSSLGIQLHGRITEVDKRLGQHAKARSATNTKKPKKWVPWSSEELVPEPTPTHLVLLSFPEDRAYGFYLVSQARKEYERQAGDLTEKEAMIFTQFRRLPNKDNIIQPNDWAWGNPHEPYGQDRFG